MAKPDEAAAGRRKRARDPLQVNLRWVVYLILFVVIVPTTLVSGLGVTVVVRRNEPLDLVFGILVTSFAVSVIAGAVLLMILAGRGARLARIQETFLSQMTHELLTPLAGIRLHAQILENKQLAPDLRRSVEAIAKETSRLHALVQRTLRWREIRRSADLYRRQRTTAGEIAELVQSRLPAGRDVAVKVLCPAAKLRGDPGALAEAVGNLLSNALKYAPGPPAPEFTVRQIAGRVIFTVADRGPGLVDGAPGWIFEPFERAVPGGMADPGGTGLGLSIARQIAKAHRGDVGFVRRKAGGCRFFIHVPLERGR